METVSLKLNQEIEIVRASLARRKLEFVLKRVFDVIAATVLLTFLLPVFLAIALLVRLSSSGPVFFVQQRVGYRTHPFRCYKFRTMVVDQDHFVDCKRLKEAVENGVLIKSENDDRVTPLGRLLRKTSIDELPQLVNVLLGDMSLVGPRPLVPHMLTHHAKFNELRSVVRPGITGLWQIRARSECTHVMFMMQHDLEYVQNFSIWYDAKILLKTLPVWLSGKGAC